MLFQLLTILIAFIATRVLWRRWKYDLHRVPSPPGLPFIGHTLEFAFGRPSHQIQQWTGECLKKLGYPKIMRADVMGSPWLFVTDADYIKDVMNSKTAPFPRNLDQGAFVIPLVGNDATVKCLPMSAWPTQYVKSIRRIYANAFQSKNLRNTIPKLNGVTDKLIKIIKAQRKEGSIDVQSLFVKMSLDVIGVVAYDTNLGGLDGSRGIFTSFREVAYLTRMRYFNPLNRAFVSLFPKSKESQRQSRIVEALNCEWEKLAKEVLNRNDEPEGDEPIWHALKNLKDPETNKPLTFKSLLSEVAGVVVGGMESTGHQLGWIFGLLGAHPHVIEKLLEELREHGLYGANAGEITFEVLGDLKYLTAVIKEGMRFAYVVTGAFLRLVPKDMTILGYRIPKNTMMIIPGTRAVMSDEMWGDPHVFRPERWLTDEDMSHKFSLGFSTGPRDCIGQKLAMLEMRFVIVKLIKQYQFTLKGTMKEMFENSKDGLATESKNGIWLQFEPRTAAIG